MRLAVRLRGAVDRADVKRGVRPGGLGQVLDDTGNAIVALDQQHVAGLDIVAQLVRIARREGFIARQLLLEVAGDQLADLIENDTHDGTPPVVRFQHSHPISAGPSRPPPIAGSRMSFHSAMTLVLAALLPFSY